MSRSILSEEYEQLAMCTPQSCSTNLHAIIGRNRGLLAFTQMFPAFPPTTPLSEIVLWLHRLVSASHRHLAHISPLSPFMPPSTSRPKKATVSVLVSGTPLIPPRLRRDGVLNGQLPFLDVRPLVGSTDETTSRVGSSSPTPHPRKTVYPTTEAFETSCRVKKC